MAITQNVQVSANHYGGSIKLQENAQDQSGKSSSRHCTGAANSQT